MRGAPPATGMGTAAPAPVQDGTLRTNSVGDSLFTNCKGASTLSPLNGEGVGDMRRFGWVALALVFLMLAGATSALAEKRIALFIGNEAYTTEIGRLANPHNDVALLEQTLKGLGFEVTTVRDAGLAALHQSVMSVSPSAVATKSTRNPVIRDGVEEGTP